MFVGLAEPVGRETIAEIVSQLVEEVVSDVVEGFLFGGCCHRSCCRHLTEHSGILNKLLPCMSCWLTEGLTLQNQLGLCKPACAYLHSQKERTSSLRLRLRKPGQLLMQESMLSGLLEWFDKNIPSYTEQYQLILL